MGRAQYPAEVCETERNGPTDTSEAWFDAMAFLEAGELLRTAAGGYP